MGFPLSRFQQLASLCRSTDKLDNYFSKFKLIAVVVHASGHNTFCDTMKNNFERLHTSTGQSFAFITFLNPPENWAKIHDEWIQERKNLVCGKGCEDDEFVEALQRRLNLPDEPCLVLTPNLMDNRYIILPTSASNVVNQMEAIGKKVESLSKEAIAYIDDGDFVDFLYTIGKPYTLSTEDGNPLARNIADLVAVRSIRGEGIAYEAERSYDFIRKMARDSQKNDAIEWVKETLNNLYHKFTSAKNHKNEEESEKALQRYSNYLADYASAKRNRPFFKRNINPKSGYQYMLDDGFDNNRVKFERESYNAIRNYNNLLPSFFSEECNDRYERSKYYLEDDYVRDFSPLGCWLGNIVEEEMNASIVQFFRKKFGIEMPAYYRLYDPGKNLCGIQTREKTIYLNKCFKKLHDDTCSVMSLPIGDTNCVIRDYIRRGMADGELGEFANDGYLNIMKCFGYLRNLSDHPGTVTREEFVKMYEYYDIIRKKFIPKMCELKNMLKQSN